MRTIDRIRTKLYGLFRGLAEHLVLRVGGGGSGRGGASARPRLLLGEPSATMPPGARETVERADLATEHVFDLLGSGPKLASEPGPGYRRIRWHQDPVSGFRWPPGKIPMFIRIGDRKGVDAIRPWELSRMQHLVTLGQAWAITGDPKYMREYKHQVTDWIDANPGFLGVNWMTSMDAALRAVSWLITLDLLGTAVEIREDREFTRRLNRSLEDHARFIHLRCRLKKLLGEDRSNHQVVGAAGLLFIAIYCPQFRRSPGWLRFAVAELERCARVQVLRDGWDYEASTSYHLLVLECFFYALVLCERAGVGGMESVRETVNRMVSAVTAAVREDGSAPQIGDNDSGRFVVLHSRPMLEHGYLAGLAATWFGDPSLGTAAPSGGEEAFWLLGAAGHRKWEKLRAEARPPASRSFPDAGWHVIRCGEVHCFISCGPNGQGGLGGHAHNDKLSFELAIRGVLLVVDPGSPAYTSDPDLRNEYRSTRMHNTFAARGCEQNPITGSLFFLEDRVEVVEAKLTRKADGFVFTGEIRYGPVRHRRTISVERERPVVRIRDEVEPGGRAGGVLSLHLAPGIDGRDHRLVSAATGSEVAGVEVVGGTARVEEYDYSPEYGVRVGARRLLIDFPPGEERRVVEVVFRG